MKNGNQRLLPTTKKIETIFDFFLINGVELRHNQTLGVSGRSVRKIRTRWHGNENQWIKDDRREINDHQQEKSTNPPDLPLENIERSTRHPLSHIELNRSSNDGTPLRRKSVDQKFAKTHQQIRQELDGNEISDADLKAVKMGKNGPKVHVKLEASKKEDPGDLTQELNQMGAELPVEKETKVKYSLEHRGTGSHQMSQYMKLIIKCLLQCTPTHAQLRS